VNDGVTVRTDRNEEDRSHADEDLTPTQKIADFVLEPEDSPVPSEQAFLLSDSRTQASRQPRDH
jgi:hypothetical protein